MKSSPWMLVSGVVFASSLVTAQGVWTQLGLTDADARAYATQVLDLGGPNPRRTYDPAVLRMKEAWYKLPASARGPAMTAIYAWTKALVSTPAFRTEYTAARAKQKPVMLQPAGTVDQEVKAKLAKDAEEQEAALKMLEANGMNAQADAQRKQGAQLQKTMATIYASEIEEKRAKDKAAYDRATQNWDATFPADVNAFLAKNLREFLDTTGDVDFTAKLVRSPVDNSLGLADPVLRRKPWQWQESVLYGPEGIAAARTAAAAWLKELGK